MEINKEEPKEQVVEKKSGKKKLIIFVVFLIVILIAIVAYFRSNSFTNPLAPFFKKNVLKTRPPKPIESEKISRRISAKKGGTISVKGKNGVYYTLNIPPGSLQNDTDVTLTPLDESPIEGFASNPDPGVIIGPPGVSFNPPGTVIVSNNPPPATDEGANAGGGAPGGFAGGSGTGGSGTSGGSSGTGGTTGSGGSGSTTGDSGTGPGGSDTDGSGDSAGSGGSGSTTGGSGTGGAGGMSIDPDKLAQIVGTGGNIDLNSILNAFGGNSGPQQSGGLNPRTSQGGSQRGVTPTPIPPQFGPGLVVIVVGDDNNIDVPPTQTESDGSESAPVDGAGTVSPNTDPNNANDVVNQAGAGGCTDDFMAAAADLYRRGNNLSGINLGILERCKDERIAQLEDTCKTDRILLRRKEFKDLITIFEGIRDSGSVKKLTDLMNTCTSMMNFGLKQDWIEDNANFYSYFDAQVCGYVDDPWLGKYDGGGRWSDGWFTYKGQGEFSIPGQGGLWVGTFPEVFTSEGGMSMTLPASNATGTFDGRKDLKTKSVQDVSVMVDTPIKLENLGTCIPAVPLPGPGGKSEPNTTQNNNQNTNNPSDLSNYTDEDAIPLKEIKKTQQNTQGVDLNSLPPLAPLHDDRGNVPPRNI